MVMLAAEARETSNKYNSDMYSKEVEAVGEYIAKAVESGAQSVVVDMDSKTQQCVAPVLQRLGYGVGLSDKQLTIHW